jgi:hypothetical protein
MPQANAQTLAPPLASTATLYTVLDCDDTVTVRENPLLTPDDVAAALS